MKEKGEEEREQGKGKEERLIFSFEPDIPPFTSSERSPDHRKR